MGGPIFVSPHRTHCTTPLSQASSSSSAYRPAIILLGLGNNLGDHQELVQTLNDKYGVPTVVAKVSRIDWPRNAAGLVDPNYWHGTQIGSDTAKNDFSVNKVQSVSKGHTWGIDQTRGHLNYVEQNCSKAVYTRQTKYVCIAGRFVGRQMYGVMVWCQKNQHIWRVHSTLAWMEFITHLVGSDGELRSWYGSPAILDQWVEHLLN